MIVGINKRARTVGSSDKVPSGCRQALSDSFPISSSRATEAMADCDSRRACWGSAVGWRPEARVGYIPDLKVEEGAVDESRPQSDSPTTAEEPRAQSNRLLLSVVDCLPRSSSLNSVQSNASSNVSNQTAVSEMYVQDGPPLEQRLGEARRSSYTCLDSGRRGVLDLAVKYSKLIDAVRHRDVTAVTSLINETPELLSTSQFHRLPEEAAVSAVTVAVNNDALGVVKLLLERGADPNVGFVSAGSQDETIRREHLPPLLLAAANASITMLKTLLRYNAKPGVVDEMDRTPLHIAAALGSRECALALVEAGARVTVVDALQFTPLDHMADLEGQQKRLIRESLDVFRQNKTRDPTASIRRRRKVDHVFDPVFLVTEAFTESEEVKALRVLKNLSRNPECLPEILGELISCIPGIILYSQLSWDNDLNKQIIQLMDCLLQVRVYNLLKLFTSSTT